MLTTSFDIMGDGMEVAQYMKFRNTLTPASGFQSAQYRLIEFSSTDLINLIDYRFRATIDRNTPYSHAFEHLYWQAAGKDYKTGEKSYLILEFERKYREEFLRYMEEYNTINIWQKFECCQKIHRERTRFRRSHRRKRLEKIHASQIPTPHLFPGVMVGRRTKKLGRRIVV